MGKLASTYSTDLSISMEQFHGFNLDPVNGRWCKPPPGYIKLNVDGGFRDGIGTYGGVLRDNKGVWMWGFTGRSIAMDPLHAS